MNHNCPKCGHLFDMQSEITGSDRDPQANDISICINCSAILTFTEPPEVRLMTEEETRNLPETVQDDIARALEKLREVRFSIQCEKMAENAKQWRKEHPNANALIQWNYPPKVAVIAPISAALKEGFVSANPEGLELLHALWPWDGTKPDEPTVIMCRITIEGS